MRIKTKISQWKYNLICIYSLHYRAHVLNLNCYRFQSGNLNEPMGSRCSYQCYSIVRSFCSHLLWCLELFLSLKTQIKGHSLEPCTSHYWNIDSCSVVRAEDVALSRQRCEIRSASLNVGVVGPGWMLGQVGAHANENK